MPVLIWKHDRTRGEVNRLIRGRLEAAGFGEKVVWKGDCFAALVGWGTILKLEGEITDDAIVLKKSSGALGSIVLAKSREAFQEMFPNGEQPLPSGLADRGLIDHVPSRCRQISRYSQELAQQAQPSSEIFNQSPRTVIENTSLTQTKNR